MARFVHKADLLTLISGSEINDSMAFIYGNFINYSLDGLGSLNHQNIFTDAITADNAVTKTGWAYGAGSYETGSGNGSFTCTLVFPTTIINMINTAAVVRIIGSQASTSIPHSYVSFDNGGSYYEINNMSMGSVPSNTGSLTFKYELIRSSDATKDTLQNYGIYYG